MNRKSNGWQLAPGFSDGVLWITPSLVWFSNEREGARGFSLETGKLVHQQPAPPTPPFRAELTDRSMRVTPAGAKSYEQKLPPGHRSGSVRWWQQQPVVVFHGEGHLAAFELARTKARPLWQLEFTADRSTSVAHNRTHCWLRERVDGGTRFRGLRLIDGKVEFDFRLELEAWQLTATDELLLATARVEDQQSIVAISPQTQAVEGTFAILAKHVELLGEPPDSDPPPRVDLRDGLAFGDNYLAIPLPAKKRPLRWAVAPVPGRWPEVEGQRLVFKVDGLLACLDLQTLRAGPNNVTFEFIETAQPQPQDPLIATVTWVGMASASASLPGKRVESFLHSTGNGTVKLGSKIVVHELSTQAHDTVKIKRWSLVGVPSKVSPLEPLKAEALPPVGRPVRAIDWRGSLKRLERSAGPKDREVRWFAEHATQALMEHLHALELDFWSDFDAPVWADDPTLVPFATRGRAFGVEYAYFFRRTRTGNAVFGGHYKDEPEASAGFVAWLAALARDRSDDPKEGASAQTVLAVLEQHATTRRSKGR